MSLFCSAGLSGLGGPTPTANPAAELQRLLNQHANNMLAVEREIQQVQAKQPAAQIAYAEALQMLSDSKELQMRAEAEAAELAAEVTQRQQDVHAKATVNARLAEEAHARKQEVDSVLRLADGQRASFFQECLKLEKELEDLKAAHLGAFLVGPRN